MADPLHLVVLAPGEILLEEAGIKQVNVQLVNGGMGILPGHTALLAEIAPGALRYRDDSGAHQVQLDGGVLQIQDNRVMIFTSSLVSPDESGLAAEYMRQGERFDRLASALVAGLGVSPVGVMVRKASSEEQESVGEEDV